MRLVSYTKDGETRVGIVDGRHILATRYQDMIDLIRAGPAALDTLHDSDGESFAADGPERIAPLPSPGKLLFCGLNYASHQQENPAATLPVTPFFFAKLPSAVVGPAATILMPESSTALDYEVELAVVIGRRARHLQAATALDHVFGYTIVNDVSARDIQFTDNQITLGKGYDTFCPMGPELVTADELQDISNLSLSSSVNGERRQSESTSGQLFSVPFLLEFLTRYITLEPGDVLSTGTPAGVGHFMNPPRYLKPGDLVEVSIEGIGTLSNRVVAGWEGAAAQ